MAMTASTSAASTTINVSSNSINCTNTNTNCNNNTNVSNNNNNNNNNNSNNSDNDDSSTSYFHTNDLLNPLSSSSINTAQHHFLQNTNLLHRLNNNHNFISNQLLPHNTQNNGLLQTVAAVTAAAAAASSSINRHHHGHHHHVDDMHHSIGHPFSNINSDFRNLDYCSYCSVLCESFHVADCDIHKVCEQCFNIYSQPSSNSYFNNKFGLRQQNDNNSTNRSGSSSLSSDDNIDERQLQSYSTVKCKICNNMNPIINNNTSSTNDLIQQNDTINNPTNNFDLFPVNTNAVVDVLKHLSLDTDEFNAFNFNSTSSNNVSSISPQSPPSPTTTNFSLNSSANTSILARSNRFLGTNLDLNHHPSASPLITSATAPNDLALPPMMANQPPIQLINNQFFGSSNPNNNNQLPPIQQQNMLPTHNQYFEFMKSAALAAAVAQKNALTSLTPTTMTGVGGIGGGGGNQDPSYNNNWSFEKYCTSCEEKPESTCYCYNCKDSLCQNCFVAHQQMRITKDHRIHFLNSNQQQQQQQHQRNMNTNSNNNNNNNNNNTNNSMINIFNNVTNSNIIPNVNAMMSNGLNTSMNYVSSSGLNKSLSQSSSSPPQHLLSSSSSTPPLDTATASSASSTSSSSSNSAVLGRLKSQLMNSNDQLTPSTLTNSTASTATTILTPTEQRSLSTATGGSATTNQNVNSNGVAMLIMMNQLKMLDIATSHMNITGNLSKSSSNLIGLTPSNIQTMKCMQHPDESCTLYCNYCNTIICQECSNGLLHHQHHKIGLYEAVHEAKIITDNLINESSRIITFFMDNIKQSSTMLERIQKKSDGLTSEIQQIHIQHLQALEQRKKDLLKNLDRIQMTKVKSLNTQISEMKKLYLPLNDSLQEVKQKIQQLPQSPSSSSSSSSSSGGTNSTSSLTPQQQVQIIFECREKLFKELQSLRTHYTNNYYNLFPLFQPFESDDIFFTPPDSALLNAITHMGFLSSSAYGPYCTAFGDGLRNCIKAKSSTFHIQTKDHLGELRCIGGDSVYVLIQTPDKQLYKVDVIDRQNGSYVVTYIPPMEGLYMISIFVNGNHIQNSPFSVQVRSGRNYANITKPLYEIGMRGEGNADGQFCRPWGVCCDQSGNIIIADRSNNRVQIFDKNGTFIRKFGTYGNRAGQFDRPAGVAYDQQLNRIIVTDKDNHRIQVFQPDGTFLFKFGEKGSKPGPFFNYPWDVAVNSESQILISDTRNHRIQLFNSQGMFLNKYGFEGPLWKQFDSPRGVAFNQMGQIIVSDFNNHRILVINQDFQTAKYLGSEGSVNGQFQRPQGCAVDHEGNIIVADSRNYRIQIFSPTGTFKCKFGAQDTGPIQMDRPSGVCVSPDGYILVVDFGNNRVLVF